MSEGKYNGTIERRQLTLDKQIDIIRDTMRYKAAKNTDLKKRISDLAIAINEAIPPNYTNLEVVVALDTLLFIIVSDTIRNINPNEV